MDRVPVRVAVVGARNCSPGGAEVARLLAAGLAGAGVCVVSGGARGVDASAHRGAMSGPGGTIVVLASGIDHPYPPSHARLFEEVAGCGALVTEYPPGTPAEPFRFPARNRIVAGLSRAVVVVEGASKSGSLITADHALDLGRDVFAVPGAVSTALAEAPLALIREGATMIRGVEDLLGDLNLAAACREGAGMGDAPTGRLETLSGDERRLWDSLTAPSDLDRVARSAGLPPAATMAGLVRLELRGLISRVGGRFERTPGR